MYTLPGCLFICVFVFLFIMLALKSLMEYYDDLRLQNISCPNEAEFRAYFLLFDLASQDFLRHLQMLPMEVFFDPRLQRAIELHSLDQRNNEIKTHNKREGEREREGGREGRRR